MASFWRVLVWTAAAVVVVMVAVGAAGLGQREPVCERPDSVTRSLDLQQPADRVHLEQDKAAIRDASTAFGEAVSRRPRLSDSIDAAAGAQTAPARAQVWCAAMLAAEAARLHQVPLEAVNDAPPHASHGARP